MLLFWTVQSACFVPRRLSQSLLLCENGIGYGGVGFTPWQKVAPRADVLFDGEGNLVIRYGSSSIVATVPPEQRGAVRSLLRDKLADQRSHELAIPGKVQSTTSGNRE